MAFSGKIGSDSGMSALNRTEELPKRHRIAISGGILVHGTALPGIGFENLPPLPVSSNLLQFLKYMDLKSVGLGLDCVPFHSEWELVEWVPKSVELGENYVEILKFCDVVEEEEHLEVFGPQIELDLGEGSSIHDFVNPR